MSLFKKSPPAAPGHSVALPTVMVIVRELAPVWEARSTESLLLRARVADLCRAANTAPITGTQFDAATHTLDGEGWRRLALTLWTLDHNELHALARYVFALPSGVPGLMEFAHGSGPGALGPLTVELVARSLVRVEEFARALLSVWNVNLDGETPEQGRARRQEISYARLIAQVDRARLNAQERMEYLRKLEDAQEAALRPRGKW